MLLRTAGHEMTHWLKRTAPAAWTEMRDFVIYELKNTPMDGVSAYDVKLGQLEGLYTYEQDGVRRSYKSGAAEGTAEYISELQEEMVCDSCFDVLSDEESVKDFSGEHLKSAKKVLLWVKDFLGRIRSGLSSLSRSDAVIAAFEKQAGVLERIRELFENAVAEANAGGGDLENRSENGENRSEGVENRSENGGVDGRERQSEVQHMRASEARGFTEDKYFRRQIDKVEDLKPGAFIRIGELDESNPLVRVGMPAGAINFDVNKINKILKDHNDYLSAADFKLIPGIISDPVAISEYSEPGTISVFGYRGIKDKPTMVGVVISKNRGGYLIAKVRTFNIRSDVENLLTDEKILYLGENKKETVRWFQAFGIQVPCGGTRFGLIRKITYPGEDVKPQFSRQSGEMKMSRRISSDASFWLREMSRDNEYGWWNDEAKLNEVYDNARQARSAHTDIVMKRAAEAAYKAEHYSAAELTKLRQQEKQREAEVMLAANKYWAEHGNLDGFESADEPVVRDMLDDWDLTRKEYYDIWSWAVQAGASGMKQFDELLKTLPMTDVQKKALRRDFRNGGAGEGIAWRPFTDSEIKRANEAARKAGERAKFDDSLLRSKLFLREGTAFDTTFGTDAYNEILPQEGRITGQKASATVTIRGDEEDRTVERTLRPTFVIDVAREQIYLDRDGMTVPSDKAMEKFGRKQKAYYTKQQNAFMKGKGFVWTGAKWMLPLSESTLQKTFRVAFGADWKAKYDELTAPAVTEKQYKAVLERAAEKEAQRIADREENPEEYLPDLDTHYATGAEDTRTEEQRRADEEKLDARIKGQAAAREARYARLEEQVKLADPVTYDDDGNLLLPSRRFDEENRDIRFSFMANNANLTDEERSLKQQLVAHWDEILENAPTIRLTDDGSVPREKSELKAFVKKLFDPYYEKGVERSDGIVTLFSKNKVSKAVNYIDGRAEAVAFLAVPDVIREGYIAGEGHKDHKNRGYSTVTIGAVVTDGKASGLMGVILKRTNGEYRYSLHKLLMPDGTVMSFEESKDAEPTTRHNSPLRAGMTTQLRTEDNIAQPEQEVKRDLSRQAKKNKFSAKTELEQLEDAMDSMALGVKTSYEPTEKKIARQARSEILINYQSAAAQGVKKAEAAVREIAAADSALREALSEAQRQTKLSGEVGYRLTAASVKNAADELTEAHPEITATKKAFAEAIGGLYKMIMNDTSMPADEALITASQIAKTATGDPWGETTAAQHELAQDILAQYVNIKFKQTFGDKADEKIREYKAKAAKQVASEREKSAIKLAKLRAEYSQKAKEQHRIDVAERDAAIKDVSKHYQERLHEKVEQHAKSKRIEQIRKHVAELRRKLTSPTEKKHIPANMLKTVIAALDLFSELDGTAHGKAVKYALSDISDAYRDAIAKQIAAPNEELLEIIDNFKTSLGEEERHIRQLSVDEIEGLWKVIRAVEKYVSGGVIIIPEVSGEIE